MNRNFDPKSLEHEKLIKLAESEPSLVASEKKLDFTEEVLNEIGIDCLSQPLCKGFIKLYPEDFIVEEINVDGELSTIDLPEVGQPTNVANNGEHRIGATLVKRGLTSFNAIENLARVLECDYIQISFCGLKDASALTAQRVVFSEISSEKLEQISLPNIILKDWQAEDVPLIRGVLSGNRFTILVRTDQKLEENKIKDKINDINERGFPNFFSVQRFGLPRLIAHKTGKLLLQNEYEAALKLFLTGDSPYELNIFRDLRKQALDLWPNWQAIKTVFGEFPVYFANEIKSLDSLIDLPQNFAKAFRTIEEQSKIFIHAYFSFLFNELLSWYLAKNQLIPPTLPFLRKKEESLTLYENVIKKSDIDLIDFDLAPLPSIRLEKSIEIPTFVRPKIWSIYGVPQGLIFYFDLPKGAYATTLLSSLFTISQSKPAPEWVDDKRIDSRKAVGLTSLKKLIDKLDSGLVDINNIPEKTYPIVEETSNE